MEGLTLRAVEIKAGLGGVNSDFLEVLLPVLNTFVEPAHHYEVIELRPFAEVGPVCHASFDAEKIVKRPCRRSGSQLEIDHLERPQYSPAVWGDLAWSYIEVVEDVLDEWVEWQPHSLVKCIWIQPHLVKLEQKNPFLLCGYGKHPSLRNPYLIFIHYIVGVFQAQ